MKLIFCDIDGTLLYDDKSLSPKNRYAVEQLLRQGDRFVIVSGRSPEALYPLLNDLQLSPEPDCIYCGGTYMERERKPVFSSGFKHAEALEIIDFLESYQLPYSIYSEKLWISPRREANLELEERLVRAKSRIGTLADVPENQLINKFFVMSTTEEVPTLLSLLGQRFPHYDLTQGMGYLIDITKGDMNKGTACQKYCELYGFAIADALCFGDGLNDVPMLEVCGRPYLMGNASAELKARFPQQAPGNEEDGVYQTLHNLGWIA